MLTLLPTLSHSRYIPPISCSSRCLCGADCWCSTPPVGGRRWRFADLVGVMVQPQLPTYTDISQYQEKERKERAERMRERGSLKLHERQSSRSQRRIQIPRDEDAEVTVSDMAAIQSPKSQELAISTRDRHIEKVWISFSIVSTKLFHVASAARTLRLGWAQQPHPQYRYRLIGGYIGLHPKEA